MSEISADELEQRMVIRSGDGFGNKESDFDII